MRALRLLGLGLRLDGGFGLGSRRNLLGGFCRRFIGGLSTTASKNCQKRNEGKQQDDILLERRPWISLEGETKA